jgi:cytochrome c biogenesis protein CcmG/thiol:disulfide interchange protein DsbE
VVGTHPGEVAPALSGTSLEGHALSLASMHGSVVVVLFWASWCTPCQAEQPSVNALAQQEVGHGVHFLGVSVDVDRSAAQSYVQRFAVPYDSLIDAGQTIVVDFEVAGPPMTFIIDGRGRVAAELVGELNPDNLRAHIASALGGH